MAPQSFDFINLGLDAILLGVVLGATRIHFIKFKEMEEKLSHLASYKHVEKLIDEKLLVLHYKIDANAEIIKSITKVSLAKK